MRRSHFKSSMANARNERTGERYVRKSVGMQERREIVRSAWQEISQIAKRGLN